MLSAVVRVRRREAGGRADAGDDQPVLLHQAADGGAALGRQVRRDYLAVEDADFQPGVAVGDGLLSGAFQRPVRRAECAEYERVGVRQGCDPFRLEKFSLSTAMAWRVVKRISDP